MLDALAWMGGVFLFLLVIAVSIGLHEGSHLVAAKALGISVPRFFIGFGPTLWSKKLGATEYGVKAIPLGGFVSVQDVTRPEGTLERELLSYVAPWRRILIFGAGAVTNLIIGFLIIFLLLVNTTIYRASTTVEAVNACGEVASCAASAAGFQEGDRIVSLDGAEVSGFSDIQGKFSASGSQVVVERAGALVPLKLDGASAEGKVGITMATEEGKMTSGEALTSIENTTMRSLEAIATIPAQVPQIARAIVGAEERDPAGVSSVVGVGRAYGDIATTPKLTEHEKVRTFIMYSGLLNLGLGLANLLPMLPLDGGRIFIALMDAVKMGWTRLRRRSYAPLDNKWVEAMTMVTGAVLLGYMALMIVADLVVPLSVI